jgi:enoyl-CoA hydratase
VPEPELDAFALALAKRVAQLPANQLHMMKLLVNQAFEQMGLHTTQLIGTLLDGSARHTPEGTEFTRSAMEDLRRTLAERDAPFGDYGQEQG